MRDEPVRILTARDVATLLGGAESTVLRLVEEAYLAHEAGTDSLPHSTFLRFPEHPGNRIISLPAYLGAPFHVAGNKWIASFPGNVEAGGDRVSAAVVLNCPQTGRVVAFVEGSLISSQRTGASAALAARALCPAPAGGSVGLVGCGPIQFEILHFLRGAVPGVRSVLVYDRVAENARFFVRKARAEYPDLELGVAGDLQEVIAENSLVSFATTAAEPHVPEDCPFRPEQVILHVSLRDLDPQRILACDNVVDDIDHVCRARTSVHLAELACGNRDFIRGTLAQVLGGCLPPRTDPPRPVVFSPFGLGVLDLAIAQYVHQQAIARGLGVVLTDFFPRAWRSSGP